MPRNEDHFRLWRRVLRPGTTVEDIDAFARSRQWPMGDVVERDRAAGTDGRVTWQAGAGVALAYVEDAMFGIGCYTWSADPGDLGGIADKTLEPWTVPDLCRALDGVADAKARGQGVLRLGLASAPGHDEHVFARISAALADADPRVRFAALWAVAFAGYARFGPAVRQLAERDPEEFIRQRAAATSLPRA
ncbi:MULTISPECIES: HEAT repeat domain-containing protein [Thermomonosporaceae]|uniref:HEAT repeat domain-containing protein n=1 Tax=Thermomonosporaceae TaxID=2012 RepID=UPI00255AEF9F|nr:MULTISPECIES: HEAT repeat domain-containing protein [Thermomonosporaceae]MDL4777173.1 HEAT repeat domain-containing protein [Actinomadura xylanilytica]